MPGSQAQWPPAWISLAVAGLLLTLLVVGVFAPALTHDFAWDDHGLIVQNPDIRVTTHWSTPFLRSFWQTGANAEDPTRSFYRPLVSLSYMIDYALWGLAPRGYHATNLLLHAIVATLVFLLGRRWLGCRTTALLAAALFAVHPSHVENVVWISGRTDMVCALFYLAALLAVPPPDARRARFVWQCIALCTLYMLALLGKEMALSLPIILLAYVTLVPEYRARWRRFVPIVTGSLAVTGVYLLVRITVLGRVVGPSLFGSATDRLLAIPAVLARYLGLLVHVVSITPHHADTLDQLTRRPALITGLLILAAYAALLTCSRPRRHGHQAFLLAWPLIVLLPVLKFGTFGDVLYADRFLYLPSIGFIMAGICVWQHSHMIQAITPLRRLLGPGLVLLFAAVSITLTVLHTGYWANNRRLFEQAAVMSPRSAYIQYNLANSRTADGAHELALQAYLRAVQQEPGYTKAFANMGIVLGRTERHMDAITCLRKALTLGDNSAVTYTSLGNAYRALGDLAQARKAYQNSLALTETAAARNNLGECLLAEKKPHEAYRQFCRAWQTESTPRIRSNLALALIEQGHADKAIPHLFTALQALDRGASDDAFAINYNLARALDMEHRAAEAHRYARRASDLWAQGYGPSGSRQARPALLDVILERDGPAENRSGKPFSLPSADAAPMVAPTNAGGI